MLFRSVSERRVNRNTLFADNLKVILEYLIDNDILVKKIIKFSYYLNRLNICYIN